MDFGFDNTSSVNTNNGTDDNNQQVTDINNGNIDNNNNGEPVDDINSITDTTNTTSNTTNNNVGNSTKQTDGNVDNTLEVGSTVEFENQEYTVDKDGNLVDKDGNVFKEAKDVKSWIDSLEVEDDADKNEISIANIQNALGIEINDENDKPVQFDNTIDGIKSYVESVIDTKVKEGQEAAYNALFSKYPVVKSFLDYYIANGNSYDGFNEVKDRNNVEIDDNNVQQQEYIIRTSWQEQGRKGDVDGYIEYLKSSGTLLAVAKEELEAIKELDAEYKKQIEEQAELKRQKDEKELKEYWDDVYNTVKNRKIAGYEIPQSIVITRNGQKLSVTPEDFFNYIYVADKDGYTQYNKDLMNETRESQRDDTLLRAYLKFVGGNYSNLVNMAINKENVAKLRLKAKDKAKSSIRVTKPNTAKSSGINIDLGYK